MAWELDGERPIYLQLAELIRLRIISGYYAQGEKLPPVRELAAEAAVNPNTMQRALAELEAGGLIVTQRTTGKTVTDNGLAIKTARDNVAGGYSADYVSKMTGLGLSDELIRKYMEEALENE